jgi:uncharacterized protein (TIGR04222 family)
MQVSSVLEAGVLALPTPVRWRHIVRHVRANSSAVERRLESAGLLLDRGETQRLRLLVTAPYVLLPAIAAVLPSTPSPAMLALTAVLILVRWLTLDRRTGSGKAALAAARTRHERLRRAPTAGAIDMGVALFGTVVLVGSAWEPLHRFRHREFDFEAGLGDVDGACGGGCGGCS